MGCRAPVVEVVRAVAAVLVASPEIGTAGAGLHAANEFVLGSKTEVGGELFWQDRVQRSIVVDRERWLAATVLADGGSDAIELGNELDRVHGGQVIVPVRRIQDGISGNRIRCVRTTV